jgi:hypothetical protein
VPKTIWTASPVIWLSSNPPGPSYPDADAGQRHSLIGIMRVLLELGGEDSAVVQVRCALSVRTWVIWWWVFFATSGFVAA